MNTRCFFILINGYLTVVSPTDSTKNKKAHPTISLNCGFQTNGNEYKIGNCKCLRREVRMSEFDYFRLQNKLF